MKASTQRALGLLGTGLLFVGAAAIFAFLSVPAYQDIQDLKSTLSSKSTLFQNQSRDLTQVQNLLSQYQGVVRLEESLNLALPTKEESGSIVNQLDVITKSNGVLIKSLGLDYVPAGRTAGTALVKNVSTLRLTIKLAGSYSAFKKALAALETNIRIMDLVSLKMEPVSAAPGQESADLFDYTLVINTYYQL
ncbi:MAG: hypothetical protein Q8P76_04030 [bacterium]|nr:hypothetical protein [bacterium]